MNNVPFSIIACIVTGIVTWIGQKLLSPREKFRQDIESKFEIQSKIIEDLVQDIKNCREYIESLELKVQSRDKIYGCKYIADCPLLPPDKNPIKNK